MFKHLPVYFEGEDLLCRACTPSPSAYSESESSVDFNSNTPKGRRFVTEDEFKQLKAQLAQQTKKMKAQDGKINNLEQKVDEQFQIIEQLKARFDRLEKEPHSYKNGSRHHFFKSVAASSCKSLKSTENNDEGLKTRSLGALDNN